MFKFPVKKALGMLALGASLVFPFSAAAAPANFSFTGSFSADDDVRLFSFTADGSSNVRLISYSYGGGTQANGNVVDAGGFDPILALFDSAGLLVGQNDDAGGPGGCGSAAVSSDPITGRSWDTCLDVALAAGDYRVAVMQYENFAIGPNLADGFTHTGNPNFTQFFGCSNGQFCDASANPDGNNRTNRWAFDILNVETAAVPEPSSWALLAVGLVALGSRRHAGKHPIACVS